MLAELSAFRLPGGEAAGWGLSSAASRAVDVTLPGGPEPLTSDYNMTKTHVQSCPATCVP